MTSYKDNGYIYFYDTSLRLWTIFKVDAEGNQIGDADYPVRKADLKKQYPMLKFVKDDETIKPFVPSEHIGKSHTFYINSKK